MENLINAKKSGIYSITSIQTKRVYIGQSKNMLQRKISHLNSLCKGKHANSHLQSIFNKYGSEDLLFSFLENCKEEELTERESFHCSKIPSDLILNQIAIKPSFPASEEFREKCRIRGLERGAPFKGRKHTEETKKKLSESLKGRPGGNTGKKLSVETRQLMSEQRKGKLKTEEHKRNITESLRKTFREKKAKLTVEIVKYIRSLPEGEIKDGVLAKQFDVAPATIRDVRIRRNWKGV